MNKRKILIVSRSFYPINSPRSFRTTELVKEFARQGHDVTLLTLKDDEVHSLFEMEYGVTIRDIGPLRWPVMRASSSIRPVRLARRLVGMGLKLLLDIELMYRVKKVMKKESGYDLLISIAVPHPIHWGVAKARTITHPIATVWAADCGDPYMGFRMDRFKKPAWFAYYEKLFCRKADAITVPIEGAREAYYEDFRHKIEVIPQGFNFSDVKIDTGPPMQNGTPVFGYAGGLWGGGRDPSELLEHLSKTSKPFRFIVYTSNTMPLEPWMGKLNGKLDVRGVIPREQLLYELAKMDFLVNLENDTAKHHPSKLIDYYLTDRPVLPVPSRGLNTDIVDHFLKGDYSRRHHFEGMDRYKFENVCALFLNLCNRN